MRELSPKAKAIELVSKFMNIEQTKMSDYSKIYHPTAIKCAKIVVEEILIETRDNDYWEEIQNELEKL